MILLANSFFLRNDPKQWARMKPYAPLATLLIAGALRARGHRVVLFDATLAEGIEEFEAVVRATRPRVVGILEDNFNFLTKMCTVRSREATLAMIAIAKRAGCMVAMNGSDSTDDPRPYFDAGADAVLPREADISFPSVAEAWLASPGALLTGIPGLALRDAHGAITYTKPSLTPADLDELPLPAWDLIDVERYRRAWIGAHGRFSWNVVTSRGCPFGCNWCAKPIFGRRYMQRSPERVAEELRRLKHEVRPDHIWFADDIFGLTASWIDAFAAAVAERDARTPFMIQCRADLLRPPVVAALAAAGAEEVWLGVESGAQTVLDAMDKGTTVDEVRQATRVLKAHGIRAGWFLQLGYPGEEWPELLATRDLVRDERPDDIGVSVAYPLPGTKFHQRVQADLGLRRNWEDSGELAMLFQGAFATPFYGRVRDALHREVRNGTCEHALWATLEVEALAERTSEQFAAVSAPA